MLELCLPTSLDSSLAPPGCHVASIFSQYTPYHLEGGWTEEAKEKYANVGEYLVMWLKKKKKEKSFSCTKLYCTVMDTFFLLLCSVWEYRGLLSRFQETCSGKRGLATTRFGEDLWANRRSELERRVFKREQFVLNSDLRIYFMEQCHWTNSISLGHPTCVRVIPLQSLVYFSVVVEHIQASLVLSVVWWCVSFCFLQ